MWPFDRKQFGIEQDLMFIEHTLGERKKWGISRECVIGSRSPNKLPQ